MEHPFTPVVWPMDDYLVRPPERTEIDEGELRHDASELLRKVAPDFGVPAEELDGFVERSVVEVARELRDSYRAGYRAGYRDGTATVWVEHCVRLYAMIDESAPAELKALHGYSCFLQDLHPTYQRDAEAVIGLCRCDLQSKGIELDLESISDWLDTLRTARRCSPPRKDALPPLAMQLFCLTYGAAPYWLLNGILTGGGITWYPADRRPSGPLQRPNRRGSTRDLKTITRAFGVSALSLILGTEREAIRFWNTHTRDESLARAHLPRTRETLAYNRTADYNTSMHAVFANEKRRVRSDLDAIGIRWAIPSGFQQPLRLSN